MSDENSKKEKLEKCSTCKTAGPTGKCHSITYPLGAQDSQKGPVGCLVDSRPIIPVLFLPGIMGSNLKSVKYNGRTGKNEEKAVWSFGSDIEANGKLNSRADYHEEDEDLTDAEIRAERMSKGNLSLVRWDSIDEMQTRFDQYSTKVYDEPLLEFDFEVKSDSVSKQELGWGTIYPPYREYLNDLGHKLNNIIDADGAINNNWYYHIHNALSGEKLTRGSTTNENDKKPEESDFKSLSKFQFDIWAQGYNWLQSNSKSSEDIASFIANTMQAYYKSCECLRLAVPLDGKEPLKVLIITHSMGGLVARHLNIKHSDKILGVIHGAMPTEGSPEVYENVKNGASMEIAIAMGGASQAKSFCAVGLQCQGMLELLISGTGGYHTKKSFRTSHRNFSHDPNVWLWSRGPSVTKEAIAMADNTNAIYEDIYKGTGPSALLPDDNIDYYDPAGLVRAGTVKIAIAPKREEARLTKNSFKQIELMVEVRDYQEKLKMEDVPTRLRKLFDDSINVVQDFHMAIQNNHIKFAYGFWMASANLPSIGQLKWQHREFDDREFTVLPGTLEVIKQIGDGTVPIASFYNACVTTGRYQESWIFNKSHNDEELPGHQGVFNFTDARRFTWNCIIKILKHNNILMTKE